VRGANRVNRTRVYQFTRRVVTTERYRVEVRDERGAAKKALAWAVDAFGGRPHLVVRDWEEGTIRRKLVGTNTYPNEVD